jgi:hypothetical protein
LRFLALLSVVLFAARSAKSSGIAAYRDSSGWHPLAEGEQRVFITVKGGVENLLLGIRPDEALDARNATQIAWILPVPAGSHEVRASLLRGFPSFLGRQPLEDVRATAKMLLELAAATQVWTIPVLMARFWNDRLEPGGEKPSFAVPVSRAVEVDVLSADSVGSLAEALHQRGVDVDPLALSGVDRLIKSDRAWALLRIVDFAAYRKGAPGEEPARDVWLGMQMTFPAVKGYFPLLSNRQSRSSMRDLEITTLGFARAATPVPSGLATEYYVGTYEATAQVRQSSDIALAGEHERYTRFRLAGIPAGEEKELIFEPGASASVLRAADWMDRPYHSAVEAALALMGFVMLALISYFGVLAIWPSSSRPSPRQCGAMAIANLLTLAGPLYLTIRAAKSTKPVSIRGFAFSLACSVLLTLLIFSLHWVVDHL